MPAVRIVLLGNSFASRVQLPALRWEGGNQVISIGGSDGPKARATADEWNIPHATGAATFADGSATMRVMDAARRSVAGAGWEACAP